MKNAVLGACAALVLASCVEHGSPLLIVQNQVPMIEERGCLIPGMRTEIRNAMGTLDVALDKSYPYFLYPLVQSRLAPMGGAGIDPNRIDITTFQVRLEPPPTVDVAWSPACPARFDFPAPVLLDPGAEASSIVEVIRPCHADLLRQLFQQGRLSPDMSERILFRAVVRAKGRHGGTEIVSDPFEFPIRVCYGCLQTGFADPEFVEFNFPRVPPCSKLAANPYLGNLCNPGQDRGPILCCARDPMGRDLECPAVPRVVAPTMR